MLSALTDAVIFTGEAFVEGHALVIRDGKVLDIVGNNKIPADAKATSHKDKILAPGFIDAQVNGGGNVMLNNTPTAEACLAIAKAHRQFGTTRILPTCITDKPEITRQAIMAARGARKKDKGVLGIHIEGPHLGEQRRGVHKADYLRGLNDVDFQLYTREDDEVMLITVAPECVPPEQIKKLRAQGLVVSLGHTQAKPEQIRGALAVGATGFTHLFNGMGKLNADKQGPADTAIADRDSWCSIIADGHHVTAELMNTALRAKPGKIFLVSDAMPPAASDNPQPFELYGETIQPENGRCVNGEGKLAGALLTLGEAVQNCIKKFRVEPDEALRMASLYPAMFLGLDKSLGKLLPGYEADVVSLATDFTSATAIYASHY